MKNCTITLNRQLKKRYNFIKSKIKASQQHKSLLLFFQKFRMMYLHLFAVAHIVTTKFITRFRVNQPKDLRQWHRDKRTNFFWRLLLVVCQFAHRNVQQPGNLSSPRAHYTVTKIEPVRSGTGACAKKKYAMHPTNDLLTGL